MMDASDKDDGVNLQDWPTVKGMYQPDSIKTFKGLSDGKRCELVAAACIPNEWYPLGVRACNITPVTGGV